MYETLLILALLLGVYGVYSTSNNAMGFLPAHMKLIREMFYAENAPIIALQDKRLSYDGKKPNSLGNLPRVFSGGTEEEEP